MVARLIVQGGGGGAAGNLGCLTAEYLLEHTTSNLNLMIHHKPLPARIADNPRVSVFKCDLASKEGLDACMTKVDVVIHYASVLFRAHPERFMPTTNTRYFENVVLAAKAAGVKRVILSSFPHVEGETSPESPSTDKLDGQPGSVHARTRLAEEQFLYSIYPDGVVLRIGMVYGKGILMPDAARWFARRGLLGVWKMDVEGAEYGIIDGLDAELLRSVRCIVMEFHGPGMPHLPHLRGAADVGPMLAKLVAAGKTFN